MQWAAWARGGEVEKGGAEGGGIDGQWKLIVQSGKGKEKDIVHRLSNLREVSCVGVSCFRPRGQNICFFVFLF